MLSYISATRRTENRIDQRMDGDIAIAVSHGAHFLRDHDPGDKQPAAAGELVNVVTVANSKLHETREKRNSYIPYSLILR